MGQLLDILVDNATRHGFEQRAGGEVTVRASAAADGHIELEVKDNGLGIDQAHIGKLFAPFFTTKLGQGGSGLGMHIAWNIFEGVLGGSISVHSVPGEGTSVRIVLPVCAP